MSWLFTREAAIGIVRTVMPFVYAWLLSLAPFVADFFDRFNITAEGLTLVVGSVIYVAIRTLAQKVPAIGKLLIFDQAPSYDGA